jgi:hypothetical protein
VRSKNTGLTEALASHLVDVVRGLRDLDLRKLPSISETIDWARTLAVLGIGELSAKVLSDTVSVVVNTTRMSAKRSTRYPRWSIQMRKCPRRCAIATITTIATTMVTPTTTTMAMDTIMITTSTITTARSPNPTAKRCGRPRTSRAASRTGTTGPPARPPRWAAAGRSSVSRLKFMV